jgi:TetR/AcrR family transcriptional regulator, transcriptional repressor of bet genes
MVDEFNLTATQQRPSYSKVQSKLIQACLEALMEEGLAGCSVRKICERAGCAVGLIHYHFGSFNELLAAAYLHLAYTLLDQAIEKSQSSDTERQDIDPQGTGRQNTGRQNVDRKRLSLFIQQTFSDAVLQRKILRAWVVFWSMIDSAPPIKAAHDASNQAFRVYLEQRFAQLNRHHAVKPSPRLAAIGLTAIIDGLWLEWCLASDTFNAQEAICLCEQWVDAACSP